MKVKPKTASPSLHHPSFSHKVMVTQGMKSPFSCRYLHWAQAHVRWTVEKLHSVLWSDETWVVGGSHRHPYVTHREGEEWD